MSLRLKTYRVCSHLYWIILLLILFFSFFPSLHSAPSTIILSSGVKLNQPSNNIVWKVGADSINVFTTFKLADTQTFFDSYWINASDSNSLTLTITIDALYYGNNITFIPNGDPTGIVTINLFLNGIGQPTPYYASSTSYDSKNDIYTVKRPADNNPVILLWSTDHSGPFNPPINPLITNQIPFWFAILFTLPYAVPAWTGTAAAVILSGIGVNHYRRNKKRRYAHRNMKGHGKTEHPERKFERND